MIRNLLDNMRPLFDQGGKLEKLYPLYEAMDTFLYTPPETCENNVHIRDGLDLKRMMIMVVLALLPCVLFAMYNTGYQANLIIQNANKIPEGWRPDLLMWLGLPFDPNFCLSNFIFGALYFLPVYIVTMTVGGLWETLFSVIRKHEINEGFLVTGLLFPLSLPPLIPLWQVALGISFGVVLGKEVFGGTGRNILNPALTARAFLFFSYPAYMSGDTVWTAVDGHTMATPLGISMLKGLDGLNISWSDAFFGFIPGSMGETSALACLIGAIILVVTGIGSWRVMLSLLGSVGVFVTMFNMIGSETNPMFSMPVHWHFVLGGLAFGTVFMATDPVSSSMTKKGQCIYGALIGFMIILVRVINPAFPEGTMLAILFGNVFAPLIDYFVVEGTKKKRRVRYG